MTTAPPTPRRLSGAFAAALLGASGLALAADPAPPVAAVPPAAITTLIGDAACDDSVQCHAVGVGTKPCGGPSRYLAWSSKKTDSSALRAAIEADAKAQARDDSARGRVSDCRIMPEPTATCRPRAGDGMTTCQLRPGGARSAI